MCKDSLYIRAIFKKCQNNKFVSKEDEIQVSKDVIHFYINGRLYYAYCFIRKH